MKPLLLVFAGGGLGSVVRYLLGKWITGLHSLRFPLGSLGVNVVACLVLGVVLGLADHRQMLSANSRIFWAVGFCGGFSTFSTFSLETLELLQQSSSATAMLYVIGSVALCLGAVYVGMVIGRMG